MYEPGSFCHTFGPGRASGPRTPGLLPIGLCSLSFRPRACLFQPGFCHAFPHLGLPGSEVCKWHCLDLNLLWFWVKSLHQFVGVQRQRLRTALKPNRALDTSLILPTFLRYHLFWFRLVFGDPPSSSQPTPGCVGGRCRPTPIKNHSDTHRNQNIVEANKQYLSLHPLNSPPPQLNGVSRREEAAWTPQNLV